MLYISKGMVVRGSSEKALRVARCGREYEMSGERASYWLAGRFSPVVVSGRDAVRDVMALASDGLVETSTDGSYVAAYRLLSQCIICPAKVRSLPLMLSKQERQMLAWITRAGFRLNMSELVYLAEQGIKPISSLVGPEKWHILLDRIYTPHTIHDGILVSMMERSPAQGSVVDAVLALLRKKRVLLI